MQFWSHPEPPPTHGETDAIGGSVTGSCRFRANFGADFRATPYRFPARCFKARPAGVV